MYSTEPETGTAQYLATFQVMFSLYKCSLILYYQIFKA